MARDMARWQRPLADGAISGFQERLRRALAHDRCKYRYYQTQVGGGDITGVRSPQGRVPGDAGPRTSQPTRSNTQRCRGLQLERPIDTRDAMGEKDYRTAVAID